MCPDGWTVAQDFPLPREFHESRRSSSTVSNWGVLTRRGVVFLNHSAVLGVRLDVSRRDRWMRSVGGFIRISALGAALSACVDGAIGDGVSPAETEPGALDPTAPGGTDPRAGATASGAASSGASPGRGGSGGQSSMGAAPGSNGGVGPGALPPASGGATPASGGTPDAIDLACDPAAPDGLSPLRRLGLADYLNSLRDLLADRTLVDSST